MAVYELTAPDGSVYQVEAPDDATEKQVMGFFRSQLAQQSKPKPVDNRGSAANALAQGATLGFADELLAGLISPIGALQTGQSIPEAYRGIRDQIRGADDAFRERNPAGSLGLEMLGGMVTGGAGALRAGGSRALANLPQYGKYLASGAGTGATAGAGYSKGETPGEVLADTGVGATVGGAIGMAIPGAGSIARNTYNKGAEVFGNPVKQTARKVAEALERDNLTPDMVRAKLRNLGSEGTIADAGGDNTVGLLRAASAYPGKAKNETARFFDQRQMAQGDRIKDSLKDTLSPTDDAIGEMEAIFKRMRERSGPLYREAEETFIPLTDKLKGLLQRPSVIDAVKKAERNAANEGRELPQILQVMDDGSVQIKNVPDMRAWQDIKVSLDDIINDNIDAFGKSNSTAARTQAIKRELLDELDNLNPKYKEARKVFENEAKAKSALEKGQKFISGDADMSFRAIQKMNDTEKQVFRIGVAKALRDRINKSPDGADAYKRVFGNKDMRNKLKMAFPNKKAFDQFKAQMLREKRFFETRYKTTGNSVTGRLEAEKDDLMVDPGVIGNLLTGNWKGALGSVAQNATSMASLPRAELRDEMAKALANKNQAEVMRLLQSLRPDPTRAITNFNLGASGGLIGGGSGLFGR